MADVLPNVLSFMKLDMDWASTINNQGNDPLKMWSIKQSNTEEKHFSKHAFYDSLRFSKSHDSSFSLLHRMKRYISLSPSQPKLYCSTPIKHALVSHLDHLKTVSKNLQRTRVRP